MLCVTSRPKPVLESKLMQLRTEKSFWQIQAHASELFQPHCGPPAKLSVGLFQHAPVYGHILHPTGWCWATSPGKLWNMPWPYSSRSCPTRLNLLKAPNQKNPKSLSQASPQNKLLFKTKALLGSFIWNVCFLHYTPYNISLLTAPQHVLIISTLCCGF